jgi:probable blue pigment (indigoidine) exporter
MKRISDILLTSIAPVIWGSTYLVTTELLPDGYPLTASLLRALPAGLILLALSRHLPTGRWWIKVFILGALNFSVFWWLLFVAAYRLPGGLAATVTSIQPLIVLMLAKLILSNSIKPASVVAAIIGMAGVAIVILTPQAEVDAIGVVAALGSALSMAAGTVLSRLWQPPVSLTTFTAWQLTAGGILLLPISLWFEPELPALTLNNVLGFTYLSLIGAALTYLFWFRGIARLGPSGVTPLGFLSPITAIVLGWLFLSQNLSSVQVVGILIVFTSIWLNQRATLSSAQTNKRSDR